MWNCTFNGAISFSIIFNKQLGDFILKNLWAGDIRINVCLWINLWLGTSLISIFIASFLGLPLSIIMLYLKTIKIELSLGPFLCIAALIILFFNKY